MAPPTMLPMLSTAFEWRETAGQHQHARRVIADAGIAWQALQHCYPEQTTDAVERCDADVTIDLLTRAASDAEQIIAAAVDLLAEMPPSAFAGMEMGYARRGRILNNATCYLKTLRQTCGERIDGCQEKLTEEAA